MNERLPYLYQRYIDETSTAEEREEFFAIIAENQENPQIAEMLDSTWDSTNAAGLTFPAADGILEKILGQNQQPVVKKISWYRYVAAASVLIALGVWIYASVPYFNHQAKTNNLAKITPGTNKATLTLADGKVITLDNAATGNIARQSGILVSKTADGQLIYQLTSANTATAAEPEGFNTISTPRGGQYQVNLPDGTKIWMNAASSLTYPTKFTSGTRRVKLSGEAYFEVAKDKAHPFIVATNKQEVEVLGTHFNINAYEDEENTKTALIEGSVKVTGTGLSADKVMLKPNQQSILTGNKFTVVPVDPESAVDWKNGYFSFDNENLPALMRKISRWYDVEITYQGSYTGNDFTGIVSRKKQVSEVLGLLELTGLVHFKIEGRRIIVMP